MTITQTIEIPADRRFMFPPEILVGSKANIIIQFPVATAASSEPISKKRMTAEEEKKWIDDNIEWLTKESMEDLAIQNMYLEDK